jgi:hypothetical protein
MRLSHLIAVASVSLVAGLWAGCTVDLTAENDGEFQCVTNADCLDTHECRTDGLCYKLSVVGPKDCIDTDGDGYGIGTDEERQKCALCEGQGLCQEDCDDNDKTRSPGAGEACNGRDDNCNVDIDEPTTCASAQDCQALSPYIPANTSVTCENQQCVVKMNTQLCFNGADPCPCNASPIACTASMYETVPDPSECI